MMRWNIDRVAFMSAMFASDRERIEKCKATKRLRSTRSSSCLWERLPSHGWTNRVWGVDVDRLYFPLFVNGNHWVAVSST
ncbi:hypothetical protein Bca52824_095146 [Brassica carinata]|uniref:Ubiquitin-like protease family profile domain-containing protein n=1 Tax=Brassica carinata TaxID=52824 RepID=A0A8X7P0R8_BRACI|nr:hypothetical protein Bca52824_095146 [Brassica carinata]